MMKYKLNKYTLDEYIKLGGNPPKHYRPSTMYFLAGQNNKKIGKIAFDQDFFMGWDPHYYILEIKSELENQGIGAALVNAVEYEAKKNKIPIVILKFNQTKLWKKMGYEIDRDSGLAWKNINNNCLF